MSLSVGTVLVRCTACHADVPVDVHASAVTDTFTGDLLVRLSPVHDHACPRRNLPEAPR